MTAYAASDRAKLEHRFKSLYDVLLAQSQLGQR